MPRQRKPKYEPTGTPVKVTQVSDLEPIKGLTSLEHLDLAGTQVSDERVAALQRALPKLRIER